MRGRSKAVASCTHVIVMGLYHFVLVGPFRKLSLISSMKCCRKDGPPSEMQGQHDLILTDAVHPNTHSSGLQVSCHPSLQARDHASAALWSCVFCVRPCERLDFAGAIHSASAQQGYFVFSVW